MDNINYEDIYEVNIDGIQFYSIEDIIDEINLNPILHFKQTSNGCKIKSEVVNYPQISND